MYGGVVVVVVVVDTLTKYGYYYEPSTNAYRMRCIEASGQPLIRYRKDSNLQ